MMVAQHLYENGRITYMRTDSVNLSKLALAASRDAITQLWGAEYSHTRNFHTHSKGAQEAHEAIRPTYISEQTIEGTVQERRLYDLIWKRTVASQMAESEIEKTVVTIDIDGLGKLPLWIIHGTADRAVRMDESQKIVRYLEENHEDSLLRYDWIPKATHGTLARVFYVQKTYDWLFKHSTNAAPRMVDTSSPNW